jgi:ribosomal protein S18 acetylase RimI-like enzyme
MNSRLRVRPAGLADLKALEALAREIWEVRYAPVVGKSQVAYMLEKYQSQSAIEKDMDDGYVYYIACFDGVPCGYSALRKDGGGIYLSKLYVKRGYGRKGIARAMLDMIDAYAKKNKAKRIWLKCNRYNTASLESYKKLGFNIIDSSLSGSEPDSSDYVLEKKLA